MSGRESCYGAWKGRGSQRRSAQGFAKHPEGDEPTEKEHLERQVKDSERPADGQFHELYGLSQEEVRIVEA